MTSSEYEEYNGDVSTTASDIDSDAPKSQSNQITREPNGKNKTENRIKTNYQSKNNNSENRIKAK